MHNLLIHDFQKNKNEILNKLNTFLNITYNLRGSLS